MTVQQLLAEHKRLKQANKTARDDLAALAKDLLVQAITFASPEHATAHYANLVGQAIAGVDQAIETLKQ